MEDLTLTCHRRFGKKKKHDSFRYSRIKTIVLIWLRTLILIPMQPGSSLVGATGCNPRVRGLQGGALNQEGLHCSP